MLTIAGSNKGISKQPLRPLLSRSSILILSGFLIGMSTGRVIRDGMETSVLLAGVAGLVAYLGLEHIASRGQRAKQLERENATLKLDNRIDRHIRVPHMIRRARRDVHASPVERQYLPVVQSSHRLSGRRYSV